MSNWFVHLQAKHSLTALVVLRPAEEEGNSHFELSLQGRLMGLQKTTSSLYTAAVCNCMFLVWVFFGIYRVNYFPMESVFEHDTH